MKNIEDLEKRFWDQVIIDGLIGNNAIDVLSEERKV